MPLRQRLRAQRRGAIIAERNALVLVDDEEGRQRRAFEATAFLGRALHQPRLGADHHGQRERRCEHDHLAYEHGQDDVQGSSPNVMVLVDLKSSTSPNSEESTCR